MKTFDELTEDQKKTAVAYARSKLMDSITFGIISLDPQEDDRIQDFATIAAETALYSEKTDYIIDGVLE